MTSLLEHQWVTSLAQRYEAAISTSAKPDSALLKQLPSLQFASASLAAIIARTDQTSHTRHVVVLGPTQSGKSTLVNVLLDTRAAAISSLAGFTVHAQGYARNISDDDLKYVQCIMSPLQHASAASLSSGDLTHYVCESVNTGANCLIDDAMVWDSPDFDSISARDYHLAVIKSAALADVIILTVSKDKYGDNRVWEMLSLLHAIQKPLLVCINKLDDADREVVVNAFTTRHELQFDNPVPPLVVLPFIKGAGQHSSPSLPLQGSQRQTLHDALQRVSQPVDPEQQATQLNAFIRNHEAQWLEPVMAEANAREQWQSLIEKTLVNADEYYQNNYLNSPDKYETFNRALAELLTLLEIPCVAPTLAKARNVITWPARRLLGVGRQVLDKNRNPGLQGNEANMDQEVIVLSHILDSSVNELQRQLLETPNDPWWQALNTQLRSKLPTIRGAYQQASEQARKDFEPEIEKAAASLYEQLTKQPALLYTLRAARASADAAGMALAVKSGGLAPTDLILAPAMLSVTTLLTESALGKYLDTIKRDLKMRQREHIRRAVFEQALLAPLQHTSDTLSAPELLGATGDTALQSRVESYRQSVRA